MGGSRCRSAARARSAPGDGATAARLLQNSQRLGNRDSSRLSDSSQCHWLDGPWHSFVHHLSRSSAPRHPSAGLWKCRHSCHSAVVNRCKSDRLREVLTHPTNAECSLQTQDVVLAPRGMFSWLPRLFFSLQPSFTHPTELAAHRVISSSVLNSEQ